MNKNNLPAPYKLQLRLLAVYSDTNTLSRADRSLLSALLRHLAEGKPTDEFFDFKKAAHRPRTGRVEQRIWDICLSMAPKSVGGNGLTRAQAIRQLAEDQGLPEDTFIESLKTKCGKALYKEFNDILTPIFGGDN
jgi:hypothetical protein